MSEDNPSSWGPNNHQVGSGRGVKRPPSIETEALENGMDAEEERRQRQSRKIVNDFMATLDTAKLRTSDGRGGGKKEQLTIEEKRERKRETNRLSAQRKRERERVQLDTLTDRYAQLNYLNEALKADNKRLIKLSTLLKDIFATQVKRQEEAVKQGQPVNRAKEIADTLTIVEKIRLALLSSVEEGEPLRLHSLDPATGSAAKSTANPFLQTTKDLLEKLKTIETFQQVLISTLQQLLQSQTLSLSHLLSIANAGQPAAAPPLQQQQASLPAQPQVTPATGNAAQLQQLLPGLGTGPNDSTVSSSAILSQLISIANGSQPTASPQVQQQVQQQTPLPTQPQATPCTDNATQLLQLLSGLGSGPTNTIMSSAPVPSQNTQDTGASASALLELLARAANEKQG